MDGAAAVRPESRHHREVAALLRRAEEKAYFDGMARLRAVLVGEAH